MHRRSLAALVALVAVPVGILTSAAVSSASPVASAARVQAVSQVQLTAANAFADDSGGGGDIQTLCVYYYYDANLIVQATMSFYIEAPDCQVFADNPPGWILVGQSQQ